MVLAVSSVSMNQQYILNRGLEKQKHIKTKLGIDLFDENVTRHLAETYPWVFSFRNSGSSIC